ncbi:TetR/AcrR family transcriptional regulator [Cellulophaga sp. HaHaR_3_176]|uniref:TetR/AcrR family transcriptional regulator n=1 Tax=Cellulophaga sp. HaHaR_3_176 TaxID=1942464 RepID=UPI001C1FD764|nr:TetR/AcrR family transcriptional regulator [Cellulophaga sp. HaHaR_3_176]QWX83448.1 TetR/AcrR family transcriptional regulator [Cellulophaga sp. HaHaR_3_176]
MIDKNHFLEFAISKFTQFGSKRFTLDDLAHEMGISKKTIYQCFSNKETIVHESLLLLLDKIKIELKEAIEKEKNNPILCIILIYRIGLFHLQTFSPSFVFGLKKYYPKTEKLYTSFRNNEIYLEVLNLLERAQNLKQIRSDVNLQLTSKLCLNRLEFILFSSENLFEKYTIQELLNHLITNNLKGIVTENYLKENNFTIPNS